MLKPLVHKFDGGPVVSIHQLWRENTVQRRFLQTPAAILLQAAARGGTSLAKKCGRDACSWRRHCFFRPIFPPPDQRPPRPPTAEKAWRPSGALALHTDNGLVRHP